MDNMEKVNPADLEGVDSEEEKQPEDKKGRRKINIEFIEDKSKRHITFSKRKLGIMKKAWELATLTGTQVLLLVASETGHVYTFATPKLQPLITKPEGKNLIQACLNNNDTPTAQLGGPASPRPPQNSYPQDYLEEEKLRLQQQQAYIPPIGMARQPSNPQQMYFQQGSYGAKFTLPGVPHVPDHQGDGQ